MKHVVALIAGLLLAVPVLAQHGHGAKGPNGGTMEDVAGVVAELVTAGNTLTVHVFDESGKPVTTKGFTASALVVAGANKETVTLAVSGENALAGTTKNAIATGSAVTVMLKTAEGKTGQARYKQ
jgi:nitrogen fixation protein FixH